MGIVAIGLSHHSSPVSVREKFSFSERAIGEALTQMRSGGIADEAVILSTCNRVEIYAATGNDHTGACVRLERFLVEFHKYNGELNGEIYHLTEPNSLEHLFRVASGLDSMVLGETEILGQLKKAYDLALQLKHTGGRLNKAFQRAFNVAKQIRTETNIQRGSISVGSVAVELAEKIFNSLADREVMVLGAGDTSEKTARALLSRGAQSVIVANRTFERAVELATELGGRALQWEQWTEACAKVDIVISSTAAPGYVLDRAKLEPVMSLRKGKPLLLVDIAVPRDIDPEVNFLENVYLYNIDDLQAIAGDYLRQREEEVVRCNAIISDKAKEMLDALRGRPAHMTAKPAFGME